MLLPQPPFLRQLFALSHAKLVAPAFKSSSLSSALVVFAFILGIAPDPPVAAYRASHRLPANPYGPARLFAHLPLTSELAAAAGPFAARA